VRVVFGLLLFISLLVSGEFKLMSEDLAPFNYVEKGKVVGISSDMVRIVLDRLGYTDENIEILPWSRALYLLGSTPNAILFSMGYNKDRALKYKFACPLTHYKIHFYKKRGVKSL